MSQTLVVNKELEPFDVYIGRGSAFGNPFSVHNGEYTLEDSLRLYEHYIFDKIMTEPVFKKKMKTLEGKKLGCFCKKSKTGTPEYEHDTTPCHGDILVKLLNKIKN